MIKPLALIAIILLLCGCLGEKQKTEFSFTYLILGQDNKTTQGTFTDSISFPHDAVYFQIRVNITNNDNITHYLKVLDQESGAYSTRLPIYSEETVNGITRDWRNIGWTESMGSPPAKDLKESLVPFVPGEEKSVEAPVFFYNQITSPQLLANNELVIKIVNASGTVLGERTISIQVT